jgi:transposase-like protein
MATATKIKGFDVTCPRCHDADATVTLDLNDLAECRCSGCDETFSPRQARDLAAAELAKWEKVVRLTEMAATMLAE